MVVRPHQEEAHLAVVPRTEKPLVQRAFEERTPAVPVPVENKHVHAVRRCGLDLLLHHLRVGLVLEPPHRPARLVVSLPLRFRLLDVLPLADSLVKDAQLLLPARVGMVARIDKRGHVVFRGLRDPARIAHLREEPVPHERNVVDHDGLVGMRPHPAGLKLEELNRIRPWLGDLDEGVIFHKRDVRAGTDGALHHLFALRAPALPDANERDGTEHPRSPHVFERQPVVALLRRVEGSPHGGVAGSAPRLLGVVARLHIERLAAHGEVTPQPDSVRLRAPRVAASARPWRHIAAAHTKHRKAGHRRNHHSPFPHLALLLTRFIIRRSSPHKQH